MPVRRNSHETILMLTAFLIIGLSAGAVKADQVFVTVPPTLNGQPISGRVTFSQSGNILTVKLENLQSNQITAFQSVSGVQFTLSTPGGTLTSSSAEHVNIAANGSYTSAGNSATDWILTESGGRYFLNGLDFTGPDDMIIGDDDRPGPDGSYSNSDGTLRTGFFNPFLKQSATFTLTIPNLPPGAIITNVVFRYDQLETGVAGRLVTVPEPTSMLLLGVGLLGTAGAVRHHFKRN